MVGAAVLVQMLVLVVHYLGLFTLGKRLLWVGSERTEENLRGFFQLLTNEARAGVRFVCSDMWQAYRKVIREELVSFRQP